MDKKRILIIEDDEALASLLSEQLRSEGFDVEMAADGETGLEAAKKKPDLILLDILLPKRDGFSVMKTIREKDEWGATVPIVIASNLNPDDDKAINTVATYAPAFYLVKSEHSLTDIVQKIKDTLSSSVR
jgi:DNA-binding response OmpR family regulator